MATGSPRPLVPAAGVPALPAGPGGSPRAPGPGMGTALSDPNPAPGTLAFSPLSPPKRSYFCGIREKTFDSTQTCSFKTVPWDAEGEIGEKGPFPWSRSRVSVILGSWSLLGPPAPPTVPAPQACGPGPTPTLPLGWLSHEVLTSGTRIFSDWLQTCGLVGCCFLFHVHKAQKQLLMSRQQKEKSPN